MLTAKVIDSAYTRSELLTEINENKNTDRGEMVDGTGFFTSTVLGIAGSTKTNSGRTDQLPDGYKKNPDGSITGPNDGRATPTGHQAENGSPVFEREGGGFYYIDKDGVQQPAKSPYEKSDIGQKREHHNTVVDQRVAELEAQGYSVKTEMQVFDSCGVGYCKPDIFYKNASGQVGFIEVKTGNAGLTVNQRSIFKDIGNNNYIVPPDTILSRSMASQLGVTFTPVKTLSDIGYANGIPVIIKYEAGLR